MSEQQKPEPLTVEEAEQVVGGFTGEQISGIISAGCTVSGCTCSTYDGAPCLCNGHSHVYS